MDKNDFIATLIKDNAAYAKILSRTSVRNFTEQPVSEELQSALLHAGMSAPSGVNRQPWEFVIIDDKDVLESLANALPYAKMTARAPMAIVVCGNPDRFLDGDDSTLWVQDLSAAAENILLAANALGLGGVWTCLYPHADRMDAASRILALPEGIVPFCLIPVGYPAKDHAPMDKWHSERVHHNRY